MGEFDIDYSKLTKFPDAKTLENLRMANKSQDADHADAVATAVSDMVASGGNRMDEFRNLRTGVTVTPFKDLPAEGKPGESNA